MHFQIVVDRTSYAVINYQGIYRIRKGSDIVMYAIVETGGKQYKVEPQSTIKVEKLEAKVGEEVILSNVLMVEKMGEIKVGAPYVKNARIKASVMDQDKHKKVVIFKYKPKKRVRVKTGHRQPYTQLKVTEIVTE